MMAFGLLGADHELNADIIIAMAASERVFFFISLFPSPQMDAWKISRCNHYAIHTTAMAIVIKI